MKVTSRFVLAIMAVGLIGLPVHAALVHHYQFEDLVDGGNATDSVGGATGVWDGDAGANLVVPGIIGLASATNDEDGGNGEEHYTIANLSGIDGASQLSLSLWFNQNVGNNDNSTYNRSVDDAKRYFSQRRRRRGIGAWLSRTTHRRRHIDWRVDGVSGAESDIIDGASGWHHVAMVYDSVANRRVLYFDGAKIGDQDGPGVGAIVTGGSWDIGNDTCCGNREFTGTLDDVAVFNHALSSADVQYIYFGGLQGLNAPDALNARIPEPTTSALALALMGLSGLARRRR